MKEPIQNDNKKQFLENFLKGQKTTEVYEDLSFNEMLEKLNDLDFSDGRTYVVCDKNNRIPSILQRNIEKQNSRGTKPWELF